MTPEEWAEQVVKVGRCDDPRYDGGTGPFWLVDVGEQGLWRAKTEADANEAARPMRAAIADVIRRAVAEAMNAGMPGSLLTAEQLAEIDARAEAATPGPWLEGLGEVFTEQPTLPMSWISRASSPGGGVYTGERREADEVFIAHAREDVPALRAHIDHQNSLIRDLAQDDVGHAYRSGYEAGRAKALSAARPAEEKLDVALAALRQIVQSDPGPAYYIADGAIKEIGADDA